MDRQEIKKELASLLAVVNEDLAARADIAEDALLRDGLGLDSLQIVELLFEIEENFSIRIPDEEAQKINNLAALLDLIQAKLDAGARG